VVDDNVAGIVVLIVDELVLFNKLLTVELINDDTVVLEMLIIIVFEEELLFWLIIVLEFEEFLRVCTFTVVFKIEEVVVAELIVEDEFNELVPFDNAVEFSRFDRVLLIIVTIVEFNTFDVVVF
jgi:hypothetical protein